MSYQFYLVVHLIAVFMIVVSLGGIALHIVNGGSRETFKARKMVSMIHGIGLVIALIAGFGLVARLGLMGHGGLPGWVVAKAVIWLILGGLPVFIYRKPKMAMLNLFMIFVFAGSAAYFAVFKPMSNSAEATGNEANLPTSAAAPTPAP